MLSNEVMEMEHEVELLKSENADLRKLLGSEPEKKMDCKNCMFYRQHYVKCGSQYVPTNAGHCTHGIRCKNTKPEDKSCRYFESKTGWH